MTHSKPSREDSLDRELEQDLGASGLSAEQKAGLKKVIAKESKAGRSLTGIWLMIFNLLGAFMVLFYLYSAGVKPVSVEWNRGIYVALTYVMIFLAFPLSRRSNMKRPTLTDLLMVGLSVFTVGYWIAEFEALNYRSGAETELDMWVGIIGLLVSIEACRRVLGPTMTLCGVFFLVYAYFGPYFPDIFAHRGFTVQRMAVTLFLEQDGVFGVMANVLVTYVVTFIFFGAFLQKSGVGRFFIDWPLALAGRTLGGPAKVSVIASAFFGSISGSAIANTVSTGTFTIPLMKRAGFKPHVAGAIEPAASIGGMFMPPIMGAGGFLMAELTNTPYVHIMLISIFPAFLYFFSVLSMIHLEAHRLNIRGLKEEELSESASSIFKKHWYKSVPLLIIVTMMLVGYSPGNAAFWATISCILISQFDKEYRMGPRQIWEAMIQGARATLVIGATVGVIGIIVGTIALTGIGLKFSDIVISLAQSMGDSISTISGGYFSPADAKLPIAIALIGIASLFLGMGVPVTASYLIIAVLAVPSLQAMLSDPSLHGDVATSAGIVTAAVAAHQIVYWFSQASNLTPPVCVAAYAGASIAGADPWKTGWTAFKFAKLLYVVPFLFAYDPAFMLAGTVSEITHAWVSALIGTMAFSVVSMGYFVRRTSVLQWIVAAVATLLCFHMHYSTNIIGVGMMLGLYFWQKAQNKRNPVPKGATVQEA
ncbi:TRAP transporter, 4TM/12TM fusion protein [Alkalidesulfovibrio alkalitolerans DSM 16529]|uniref:TRAP transporter, 4TM/12TM fusion protein n=1 Tax=Alkalidesulfovibrio alkalitolerans DSM 16529 TaxID=1121439 RepID=S7UL59_9BACT|nr:TRAP transporter permease [Alkalidesulfovibrio alkalitolerans]EPR34594.1 TRAP transporter, 4TM/12TM fusion protein [Alkalidesulfovibrio alkalitolerans DSM 16529]